MRVATLGLAGLGLCLSAAALAQDTSERELGDDRVITVTINGRETPVEVAPNGTDSPVIAPLVAQELSLKGSMIGGVRMVGNTRFSARSNVIRLGIDGGKPEKRRSFWFEQPWGQLGEGRIGPATLPEDIVTFRIAPSAAGEQVITLPMEDQGLRGMVTHFTVGDERVAAYFSFERGETMMPASTGVLLANAYGGKLTGEPREILIELGVSRPVQPMLFDSPVMLGALPVTNFVVRTKDTGSIGDIPLDTDAAIDESEIVVTADSKRKVRHHIIVGLDSLQGCSTLTFDKPARQIRLSCLPR